MDPSPIDLSEVYGELASLVPKREDEEIVLSRDNIPEPPAAISTSRFGFRRPGLKFYDNYPVPRASLCIDRGGCALLALLTLARVFYPEPEAIDVHLTHHDMQLDLLRLKVTDDWPAYRCIPESFTYVAKSQRSKNTEESGGSHILHPDWTENAVSPLELPMVEITTRDELGTVHGRPWPEGYDTVVAFGSERASVRMAELLMDVALEDHTIDEVQFWSLFYYRSVAVGSAELVIWLPGGLGYIEED
jgi:hypothetical protein